MAETNASANGLITRFKFQKLLNQDQGGRRAVLQGTISGEPALLLAERAAFSNDESYLSSFSRLVTHVNNLGANDIYHWYMANSLPDGTLDQPTPPDLKINLIYPCKDSHIRKYSFQQSRVVLETPDIYTKYVRPYMQQYREEGKLNWVFNILEGRKEQENVLYRSKEADAKDDFLLLPDLNWDRTTIGGLHLLALVERRDIWSVRDLKKKDVTWLRHLRSTLTKAVEDLYEGVENDMLKFYIHYQPTYYHFHIHVVHVNLDPTATQAVGKAIALDNVISQLDTMGGDEDAGMADVELSYTVGEASELWTRIFLPLKQGKAPDVSN
ncbi:hypothetical protein MBLNU13_g10153t1 [Cladosporium sp. NU13]